MTEVLHLIQDETRGNVALIGTFEDVFTAMFGPRQHEAHVWAWKARQRAQEIEDAADRFDGWFKADMERRDEEAAQELARTSHYDTAVLRRGYDRYATGCFSKEWNAGEQRRIALRALDIAIAWHDAKFLDAAE